MHSFIAFFGSAAHLALVAAAPLLLCPFCSMSAISAVVCGLLPFAALWVLMEPSVYAGEHPHDARRRVARSIRHDAFTWIWLVLLVHAAFCAINCGVSYGYDPERTEWLLTSPRWAFLPGSADGAGGFPLAMLAALGLAVLAMRNAFGRRGGSALMMTIGFLFGIAGFGWLYLRSLGVRTLPDGTIFGVALVMSVAAIESVFDQKWVLALPVLIVAQAGNIVGLVGFCSLVTVLAFLLLWLILSVWMLLRLRGRSAFYGGIACPLVSVASLLVAGLLLMTLAEPLVEERIAACSGGKFFADGYFPLRTALSECAKSAWLASPWTGSGIGTFALDIRAYLPSEVWSQMPQGMDHALNGWWQLLAEGGILRVALWLLMLGYVLYDWGSWTVSALRCGVRQTDPVGWIGPLTIAVLAGLAFFSPQPLDVEVVMLAMVLVAVSMRTMESLAIRRDNG